MFKSLIAKRSKVIKTIKTELLNKKIGTSYTICRMIERKNNLYCIY